MAHIHEVKPTDNVLMINPVTRVIEGEPDVLAQRDHNSVRYIFQMPRYIHGHDMVSCSRITVHYNNIVKDAKTFREGVYEVDDKGVNAEDENLAVFTWLISGNATQLKGSLNFAITFECLTGEEVDYSWSTFICKKGQVGEGMNNSEEVMEMYADILVQWEQKILDKLKASVGALAVDETLTESGKAADAKVVGEKMPVEAEVDDDGVVSFKNLLGVTVFTVNLSEFSGTDNVYGELVLSAEALDIGEGSTGIFTVKLASAPTTNQPVYLVISDNTKLSVSPSTLTFTPENWETEQNVTVTSLEDEDENDESITILLTSKKVSAKSLIVSISDNDVYIPFNGKEIASNLDFSTWSYCADNEDGQPRCTDIANDEVIIGVSNNGGLIKPLEQFTSGTTAIVGERSIAGTKIDNNTSGNYTFLFVMSELPSNNSVHILSSICPISYLYWNTEQTVKVVWCKLLNMKYLNTDGETIDFAISNTMTDILVTELEEKNWNAYYSACVLHNDGSVEYHVNGVPIYIAEAIEGFVSWVWEGYSWSTMGYLETYLTDMCGMKNALIINDAVTPEEIVDYYNHQAAATQSAF